MSWSMDSISFRMAGSGSWQYLLADEFAKRFYSEIYPAGIALSELDDEQMKLIASWQDADVVKIQKNQAIPLGPVMTDGDITVLKNWFNEISGVMCNAVKENYPDYKALASKMIVNTSSEKIQNLLTIMICAHTLDSMVFSHLRSTVMGSYVPRGVVGTFYFWGYGFSEGPKRIYGFTSYGGYGNAAIHVIRSHALDRENLKQILQKRDMAHFLYINYIEPVIYGKPARDFSRLSHEDKKRIEILKATHLIEPECPTALSIPVFFGTHMREASGIYINASTSITRHFMENMEILGDLVKQCSFARCPSADVLCMLFHLAYSFAADALVEEGIVSEFPKTAAGEWGVWIH